METGAKRSLSELPIEVNMKYEFYTWYSTQFGDVFMVFDFTSSFDHDYYKSLFIDHTSLKMSIKSLIFMVKDDRETKWQIHKIAYKVTNETAKTILNYLFQNSDN